MLGIPTGITKIDEATSGFRPGKIWVIGGYNAYGKTYFMTNMINRVLSLGKKASVITLEMSKEDIIDRLLSERLGIGVYELAKTVNKEAVDEELKNSGLAEDEQEAVRELRVEKALDVAGEWWEYGEYITVEFDTEARTARVVPVDEK